MKNFKSLIFGIFFISLNGIGQTVSIPDPVLQACIAKKISNGLDSNKNLILKEALKATGVFSCAGAELKNAEGIQYLININKINISGNQLRYIPDLSPLKKLQVLDVSENQLTSIFDLGQLQELKDLDIKNNRISSFPNVSKNIQLEVISATNNQFDTIVGLNNLTNLKLLYLGSNQLKSLPDLNQLSSLIELRCDNNKITEVGSLGDLPNLSTLNLSNNIINKVKRWPSGRSLKWVDLSNNNLSSLPEFNTMDSLKSVSLKNNYLTFETLFPISLIENYNTIFLFNPQKTIPKGRKIQLYEGDSLWMPLNQDTAISDVTFQWFFNEEIFAKTQNDGLLIFPATLDHAGFYHTQWTHPKFPSLTIRTDSFTVEVAKCIHISDFTTTIAASTCEKAGMLQVVPKNMKENFYRYVLKSVNSQKEFVSLDGDFKNLTEPAYQLTISSQICKKEISSNIIIPHSGCTDPYITPDGDGINDTFFFHQKGKATISDKWGNTIHTLELPAEWDGKGTKGIVSPGLYNVNINDGEQLILISVVY